MAGTLAQPNASTGLPPSGSRRMRHRKSSSASAILFSAGGIPQSILNGIEDDDANNPQQQGRQVVPMNPFDGLAMDDGVVGTARGRMVGKNDNNEKVCHHPYLSRGASHNAVRMNPFDAHSSGNPSQQVQQVQQPHPLDLGNLSIPEYKAGNEGGVVQKMNPFDTLSSPSSVITPSPALVSPSPVMNNNSLKPLLGSSNSMRLNPTIPTPSTPVPPSAPGSEPSTPKVELSPAMLRDLSSIAKELSVVKPRKATEAEEAEESRVNNNVTLGSVPSDSTGTSKSHFKKKKNSGEHHRRNRSFDLMAKNVSKRGIGTNHPKGDEEISSSSYHGPMNADILSGIVDQLNEGNAASKQMGRRHSRSPPNGNSRPLSPKNTSNSLKKHTQQSSVVSPKRQSSVISPKRSPNRSGLLSLRNLGGSTTTNTIKTTAAPPDVKKMGGMEIPTLTDNPNTTTTTSQNRMRSSEEDPVLHQMQMPAPNNVLMLGRMCSLMDSYRIVDQNFDMKALVGMSRLVLEGFVSGAGVGGGGGTSLVSTHRPIVSSVIECADDLVLEGFFHEIGENQNDSDDENLKPNPKPKPSILKNRRRSNETSISSIKTEDTIHQKSSHERTEIAIFSSHRRRQFIVCYRGSTDSQLKPVLKQDVQKIQKALNTPTSSSNINAPPPPASSLLGTHLHPTEQPVSIFPPFRHAYFKEELENKVFELLDKLSDESPFFDVIMTGHSFGAALANVGAVRYASVRPMMRVEFVGFGCPKVGGRGYRHLANSLPNLKIVRFEYGTDPYVNTPDITGYLHSGHTITISPTVMQSDFSPSSSSSSDQPVKVYTFDTKRTTTKKPKVTLSKKIKMSSSQGNKSERMDHDMSSYVNAIDRVTHLGVEWPENLMKDGKKGGGDVEKKEKTTVV